MENRFDIANTILRSFVEVPLEIRHNLVDSPW